MKKLLNTFLRSIGITAGLLICMIANAQTPDGDIIYLDLSLGSVSINGKTNKFTGYVGVAGTSKKYNEETFSPGSTVFYIYQSSTVSDSPWTVANTGYATQEDFTAKQNIRLPQYDQMTVGIKPWADYITDNSSVEDVAEKWEISAAAVKRSPSDNIIRIQSDNNEVEFNVIIDDIWSSYCWNGTTLVEGLRDGGISIKKEGTDGRSTSNEKVTLKLKGDSRISNIWYGNNENGKGYLHITSNEGDGEDSGSLTVAYPHGMNIFSQARNNESIIGPGLQVDGNCYNLEFNGGTVFAGCQKMTNQQYTSSVHPIIHVIGARRKSDITVNGGRLTSVSNSTAAAIGGGGGYAAAGGIGYVTINGGEVYAYNHSIYAQQYGVVVPCVAIGGGSGVEKKAIEAEVTINGGYVYAQSAGGVAIGGGGSSKGEGGAGTVTITGGEVHAKSISGTLPGGHSFPAGASFGGGTGTSGGNAIVNISGTDTKVVAGSVGGGTATNNTGQFGSANVTISGGDIQAQFIMQAKSGASSHCTFDMTGGTIRNSSSESTEYVLSKQDGAALWINDPNGIVTISNGIIKDCRAQNGGAIFQSGGTFTMSGNAIIEGNTALKNGGALYISGGVTTINSSNAEITNNLASLQGGGLYVSGGAVTFNGNIHDNNASNGAGLFLASGAQMTFTGGVLSANNAKISGQAISNTAYYGRTGTLPIEGCGGGIYLENGPSSSKKTSLKFQFPEGEQTFGLYGNTADKAGQEILAEGGNTDITLPAIANMKLAGFEGQDANPNWYQDYFTDDDEYGDNVDEYTGDHHAVTNKVSHIDRYKNIMSHYGGEFVQHLIPDETLGGIKNKYLAITLGFSMLDLTVTANGLLGGETALVKLIRYGSSGQKTYDVMLKKGESETAASKTLINMPWGTYSIIPNNSWNWHYEPINPMTNIRLGDAAQYEIVLDYNHRSVAEQPLHYDVHD